MAFETLREGGRPRRDAQFGGKKQLSAPGMKLVYRPKQVQPKGEPLSEVTNTIPQDVQLTEPDYCPENLLECEAEEGITSLAQVLISDLQARTSSSNKSLTENQTQEQDFLLASDEPELNADLAVDSSEALICTKLEQIRLESDYSSGPDVGSEVSIELPTHTLESLNDYKFIKFTNESPIKGDSDVETDLLADEDSLAVDKFNELPLTEQQLFKQICDFQ